MENIVRTEKEIDEVLERCVESEENGTSAFPGKTYEEGIVAMYEWLTGTTKYNPFE